MREVSRIDVDSTELRIMQTNENQWYEIYESSKWSRVSAIKLHTLSFDKRVYDWLSQHRSSANNA